METYTYRPPIRRPNGSYLALRLRKDHERVDWDQLNVPTLALLPCTAVYGDALTTIWLWGEDITGPWFPRLYDSTKTKLMFAYNVHRWTMAEFKEIIDKAPPMPTNLDVICCDHICELYHNELMEPYLLSGRRNRKRMFSANHVSVVQIKQGLVYNSDWPDDKYERMIDEWTWSTPTEYVRKLNQLLMMPCTAVYDLMTFESPSFKLNPCVRSWLSKIRWGQYGSDPCLLFTDAFVMNELDNEIMRGTHCQVITPYYKRLDEFIQYRRMTLDHVFHTLRPCVKSHALEIDHVLQLMKRHKDVTSEVAKMCFYIGDWFKYDETFVASAILNWRMRPIEWVIKNRRLTCHEAAWLGWLWLPKIYQPRTFIFNRLIEDLGIMASHSLLFYTLSDGVYLFESSYGPRYGCIGPLPSVDEFIKFIFHVYYPNGTCHETTGKMHEGMNVDDLSEC